MNVSAHTVNRLFWATFIVAVAGALASWLSFINDNEKSNLQDQLRNAQDSIRFLQGTQANTPADTLKK